MSYIAFDHYWRVADVAGSKAWSSAAKSYVSASNVTFKAWQAAGNEATYISSEAELREVLRAAGFPTLAPGYVPLEVAMWQAREVLRLSGKFGAVDAAVTAAGGALLAAWEYGNVINRNSDATKAIASLLNLTPAEVDALFIAADNIKIA